MSPSKQKLPEQDCIGVRRLLDRIGDKWSLYIIGTLQGGPMRFNEIRRHIDGLSQRMLTLTLRDLERNGLVTRTVRVIEPKDLQLMRAHRQPPVGIPHGFASVTQPAVLCAP